MEHRVFVYGTLLGGEVNHHLLRDARFLGPHRTEPRFTLLVLGAYPGLVAGGDTAVLGEVYGVDAAGLRRLDRLEDYPRLYDRRVIPTAHGSAWVYLYRGPRRDRAHLAHGDWRRHSGGGGPRAAAARRRRDPKNPSHRRRMAGGGDG
ncbi:gamma-glutamylcyclotransferase [uncultured Thiohalocapsa sp.]|uniref:gamma-glutamylcyclotransferase family protein n=1 Tax=uncultured Thiohalocapsa sp. TaxID=768990 RepID=UPI0025F5E213|nr:gamma-glutamylcyclotransferase family protein [uncultured Thiohalocapsa sp.]